MAGAEGECPPADPTQPPVECPAPEDTTTTAPPEETTTRPRRRRKRRRPRPSRRHDDHDGAADDDLDRAADDDDHGAADDDHDEAADHHHAPPAPTTTRPPATTSTTIATTTTTPPTTDDHRAAVHRHHREEPDDQHDRPPSPRRQARPGAVGHRRPGHVAAAGPPERPGAAAPPGRWASSWRPGSRTHRRRVPPRPAVDGADGARRPATRRLTTGHPRVRGADKADGGSGGPETSGAEAFLLPELALADILPFTPTLGAATAPDVPAPAGSAPAGEAVADYGRAPRSHWPLVAGICRQPRHPVRRRRLPVVAQPRQPLLARLSHRRATAWVSRGPGDVQAILQSERS